MEVTVNKSPKLDIFRVLNALNDKNVEFFDGLTEDEQKAFIPFLVMRWMSGTSNAKQVYLINELINPVVFSLTNHKKLMWYLLTICNSGKSQRYVWIKPPSRAVIKKPVSAAVVSQYLGYSSSDATDALKVLDVNDVVEMATDLGLQPEELNKILKEHGETRSGKSSKSSKPPAQPSDDIFEF